MSSSDNCYMTERQIFPTPTAMMTNEVKCYCQDLISHNIAAKLVYAREREAYSLRISVCERQA